MTGLISGLKRRARRTARAIALSAALSITALILALAGLGCLTAALWIVIATHQGVVFAYAFIGIVYLALGALFLALAAYTSRNGREHVTPEDHDETPPPPPPPREPFVQIAEGFAIGMQAGRAARRGSR